jgi:predicted hotdog family 3-hydroxylacyl-ACP dehydratase
VNTDLPLPLTALMPHRAPMLLLNTLESFSSEEARGTVEVHEGNPFLRPDGKLERAAYAEIMAQCFAAGAGASLHAAGRTCGGWGYLAALRDMAVHDDARLGQHLDVLVRVATRLGEVTVVEGEVRAEGRLLATGQFKIFIPEEAS